MFKLTPQQHTDKELLNNFKKFMFTSANMRNGYMVGAPMVSISAQAPATTVQQAAPATTVQQAAPATTVQQAAPATTIKNTTLFTPFQKDKLFWCFFIVLKGYDEYEMKRSNSFSIEKQIKIETVEKLKSFKDQLKKLKLKRTELEDELVNKQMITIKGLCALCLVHNVSMTYVFGRKYCMFSPLNNSDHYNTARAGIIIQNEKKEDSLKWTANEINSKNDDFLTQLREEYWLIENIQKPLKAPSAYSLPDLQLICQKLLLETHNHVKNKPKTKSKLYEEIIQYI